MTEPIKYVARPAEVEAIVLTQYGAFIRARDWVNQSRRDGLQAYFVAKGDSGLRDQLILAYEDRNVYGFEDDVLVRSSTGEFSIWTETDFVAAFARGFDPPAGSNQPRGQEGTSLLGAGAPRLPR